MALAREEVISFDQQYNQHPWLTGTVNPIPVEKGKGIYFWDYNGTRYTDMCSQLGKTYHEELQKTLPEDTFIKCNKEALKKWQGKYKSIVSVNRNSNNYMVDEVICDGRKVATMAVEYLVSLGHRSIGYVGECHNESRYRGFLDVLNKHDIDVEPDFIIETKQTESEGFEAMRKIPNLC